MLVDFVVRSDALVKPGGDSVQVDAYLDELTARGVDAQVHPYRSRMALRPGSIVHVVNIDRPFDFLDTCAQAHGRPLVASTIHHDLHRVRAMRRAERGWSLRALAGRVLPESGRELAAYVARTARDQDWSAAVRAGVRAVPHLVGVWAAVGYELDAAVAVALLARGEGESLRRDTGWSGRNGILTPNGVPPVPRGSGADWAARTVPVLVVGRVEPRKRQLEIARAAAAADVPVVFAGAPSTSSPGYAEEFRRVVDGAPGLRYDGALAHPDVLALMASSRVLLNASFVEVQSLVDIEAAMLGAYVVCIDNGHSGEWLGPALVDAGRSVASAVALAGRTAERPSGPAPTAYPVTWSTTVDVLVAAYVRAQAGAVPGAEPGTDR